jgi:nitrite reductase/ring-hydroxylating ferredoxin subunit
MTSDDEKGSELASGPWVDVADEVSLRRHGRCLVRMAGQDVAVFAVGEELFAIDDSCPHAGASLCTGRLHQREVQCRAHGLRFRLTDGLLSTMPANSPTQGGMALRVWPVRVANGRLEVRVESAVR